MCMKKIKRDFVEKIFHELLLPATTNQNNHGETYTVRHKTVKLRKEDIALLRTKIGGPNLKS